MLFITGADARVMLGKIEPKIGMSCPRFPLCGRSRRAEQGVLVLGLDMLYIGLTFGLKKLAYGVWVLDSGRARPAKITPVI